MDRSALIDHVAAHVVALRTDAITRVAIDGVDGAGKTHFADELANAVRGRGRPVIRVSVDHFHHPRAFRYRQGRNSPRGFFEDSYDYAALRVGVLDALSPGGSLRYTPAIFSLESDSHIAVAPRDAVAGSVLIVDGIFLNRDELNIYWHFSVLLEVAFGVSVRRMAARDGTSPDADAESNFRYVEGQRLYFARCQPRARASLIVNNENFDAPYIVAP